MSALSPYAGMSAIGGSMNLSGLAASGASALSGLSGNPSSSLAALGSDYASAYNAALSVNQQMYSNILSGYQQTLTQQVAAEAKVSQGYTSLYNNVMNTIKGITASQSQAISDAYAQQAGTTTQQLANQGLGNTTVAESEQAGNLLQEQKAQIALANQQAGLTAGYQSQLGLAGLQYSNQAIQQNTAEANQQLGFMNSVMMPYPNGALYGQLAQGYGALQAAQAGRGLLGARNTSGAGQGLGITGMGPPAGMFAGSVDAGYAAGYSGAGGGLVGAGNQYSGYAPIAAPKLNLTDQSWYDAMTQAASGAAAGAGAAGDAARYAGAVQTSYGDDTGGGGDFEYGDAGDGASTSG